jgi:hypothetical protein
MNRALRILLFLVAFIFTLYVALFVAAYLKPTHNRIALWSMNLEAIVEAKRTWAGNRVNNTNDAPTFDELQHYLPDWATNHISWTHGELVDTNGGVYTIGRLDERPSCLIGGVREVFP